MGSKNGENHRRPIEELENSYEGKIMLETVILIILILLLIGALPRWKHSAKWGYGPSGGIGTILIIVIILLLLGVI